jgi:hypothetical protein
MCADLKTWRPSEADHKCAQARGAEADVLRFEPHLICRYAQASGISVYNQVGLRELNLTTANDIAKR